MTTQEKLQVVTDIIRKHLPRLRELSMGCKLEKDGYFYTYLGKMIPEIDVRYTNPYYLHHFYSEEIIKDKKETFLYAIGDKKFKHYKVVGHDVMLTDVLEWLGNIYIDEYDVDNIPTFNVKGRKVYALCFQNEGFLNEGRMLFDFSKPRLEDQSDELIDFLYNLIKK